MIPFLDSGRCQQSRAPIFDIDYLNMNGIMFLLEGREELNVPLSA